MKTAIIGIGSNSLRMLLADIEGSVFRRIKRYRSGLRVFSALDEYNCISDAMIQKACNEIKNFIAEGTQDGAASFHIFATSATRDAKNQKLFTEEIYRRTGLHMHVCSGNEEALLSFLGAVQTEKSSGMIDIGGGSTEIALGSGKQLDYQNSFQIGAVRLSKNNKLTNITDVNRMIATICSILSEKPIDSFLLSKREWSGVGGTFTSLAAFAQKCPWDQREKIDGYMINRFAVDNAIDELTVMSLEERCECGFIQPQRADIILHGVCILKACMNHYDIESIRVSECGNLEGYVKAYLLGNFNQT